MLKNHMDLRKKVAVLVMTLTGFIFGVSFSTLYAQTHIIQGTACGCTLPIPVLIPTFSSLGVFVGSLVYYFMPQEVKEGIGREEVLELIKGDRKRTLKLILENEGEILQSELSGEFGKVKAHRLVKELKEEGIIEKEPYGRTNKIKLKSKFENLVDNRS